MVVAPVRLLVDGNNLLSRAHHAAVGGGVPLGVNGHQTASLFIFINMLAKYVRLSGPTSVRVCWDEGHEVRTRMSALYKAARDAAPSSTNRSRPFEQAERFVRLAGLDSLRVPGWEADDLIAATVRQHPATTVIVSGDKDLLQLVSPSVTVIRPPEDTVWNPARVTHETGARPAWLPLLMALTGDASDGVVGVRGYGPKKALSALREADWDWDTVLDRLSPTQADEARLGRALVDLLALDYEECGLQVLSVETFEPVVPGPTPRWDSLARWLDEWQMASVRQRLEDGTMWAGVGAGPGAGTGPETDTTEAAFDGFPV